MLRGRITEQWWIWQLESADEAAVRHVATRLVEAKAVRAIPRIVARLEVEHSKPTQFVSQVPEESPGDVEIPLRGDISIEPFLSVCLIDFGPEGVAGLLGLRGFDSGFRGWPFDQCPTLLGSLGACLSNSFLT